MHKNELNKMMATTVTHETMTPLNCILTFTRILFSLNLGERANHFVGLTERTTLLMKHNMRDLLDKAQLERQTFKSNPQPANPWTLVQEVIDMLKHSAISRGVVLSSDNISLPGLRECFV